MPALRPTPTTVSLVERQLGGIGGGLGDAGAAIGGGVQTGIAGAGGGVGTAIDGASGAIETAANAPNAAISAGANAAGDQIADEMNKQASAYMAEAWANLKANFMENALIPILVVFGAILFLVLVLWRRNYMKARNRTFLRGTPIGEGGDVGDGKGKEDSEKP